MENSSNDKATRGSKVDDLPVAFPDSPNLGIAEARRDDSVPHVCENQVGLTEAALHLTEEKETFDTNIISREAFYQI